MRLKLNFKTMKNMKKLSKSKIATALTLIILLAMAGGFLVSRYQLGKKENGDNKKVVEEESKKIETSVLREDVVDTSKWKTYKNEEFGFEMKYPEDWEIEIKSSNPNNLEKKDSFIFKKEKRVYFAIFTNGGFGYGVEKPQKISNENFHGKKAEMSWHGDDFPRFIHISDGLPKNWSDDNIIEMRNEGTDILNKDIFKYMYKTFNFIE